MLYINVYIFVLYFNKCKSCSLMMIISRLNLFAFLHYTSGCLLSAKKKTKVALPFGM